MPDTTATGEMLYEVVRAPATPELRGDWDGPAWGPVQPLDVAWFHPRSSDHRPNVQAKTVYDDKGLYVHYRVSDDRYVRAANVGRQAMVCRDSCVEFFVRTGDAKGYFNFEINCGGSILLWYNIVPRQEATPVSDAWLDKVKIYHSLPERIDPEMPGPVTWQVEWFAPYAMFEAYAGPAGRKPEPGDTWEANWYKCGDECSQPHWAAWSPVGEVCDFHKPSHFGTIRFV